MTSVKYNKTHNFQNWLGTICNFEREEIKQSKKKQQYWDNVWTALKVLSNGSVKPMSVCNKHSEIDVNEMEWSNYLIICQ